MLEEELDQNKGNTYILPCFLKRFKKHPTQIFPQRVALYAPFQTTQERGAVDTNAAERSEVQPSEKFSTVLTNNFDATEELDVTPICSTRQANESSEYQNLLNQVNESMFNCKWQEVQVDRDEDVELVDLILTDPSVKPIPYNLLSNLNGLLWTTMNCRPMSSMQGASLSGGGT